MIDNVNIRMDNDYNMGYGQGKRKGIQLVIDELRKVGK